MTYDITRAGDSASIVPLRGVGERSSGILLSDRLLFVRGSVEAMETRRVADLRLQVHGTRPNSVNAFEGGFRVVDSKIDPVEAVLEVELAAIAVIGIVIQTFTTTGLGVTIAQIVEALAGGRLWRSCRGS